MAKAKPETTKKPKRRLRAAPTLREQTTANAAESNKPAFRKRVFGSKAFAPVRAAGTGIKNATVSVKKSKFGKSVTKTYKSRVFAPIRFVVWLLSKILLVSYFKASWQELKQVTWPGFRKTWHLTFAVLVFAIIFGFMVAGLDWVFEKAFREVLLG